MGGGAGEKRDFDTQLRYLFDPTQKTAYEISLGLVGSEMCIRDRCWAQDALWPQSVHL